MPEWFKDILYPFFEWCDATTLASFLQQSTWLFPVIEAFHLVAFAALGGTILLVDLRLMGLVLKQQPVAQLAEAARRWFYGSLALMFVSGGFLFVSETTKLFYNDPFWSKMKFLVLGILFMTTVRRKVISMDPARVGHWAKLVGMTNIVLWAWVAWGGRWIGFW